MRLSQFITEEMEAILAEWDRFAATLLPASAKLQARELRDHAQQILEAVVVDLQTPQTDQQRHSKSWGHEATGGTGSETAAREHAYLRARDGFDICQLTAEYRALRASVLQLWVERCPQGQPPNIAEVMRFNEAIDQALAQAMALFSKELDYARNLLLSALGHDMRSPLQTITMTASALATLDASPRVAEAASRLTRSSASLQRLVNDLLDYHRAKLGLGIEIAHTQSALSDIVREELDQLRAAYPAKEVTFETHGNTIGMWDAQRLQQLLANLVVNAFKYGGNNAVSVVLTGSTNQVVLTVSNAGPAIKVAPLDRIFDPLMRGDNAAGVRQPGSMGLGLYIARVIAKAHHGSIGVTSDDAQTVFTVVLPTDVEPPETDENRSKQ